MATNPITPKDAVRELWYRGVLSWKLHEGQKKMLASYLSQNREITVVACARRFGKSHMLCLLAVEKCLQIPNAIVKYVCPRKNMVKQILQPVMQEILKDCPAELRPEFKYNEYMYVFPNGSQIQMAGTDNGHHESLRGGRSELWIVDEAGFCDELNYVVKTILAPTADTTGGRGILASTPSKTPDHDFIVKYLKPAAFKNELIKYTIYDNPMISKEKLQEIINRYPQKEKDPEFRREYLCEIFNSGDLAIIPEFTEELEGKVVQEVIRPPFFDSYVSMDIGFKDLTVILFGYYDFKNGKMVIEDELVANGKELLLDKFAAEIKKKEEGLWTNLATAEFRPPYLRIADNNNPILLNELMYKYNISFLPTRKDNKEAALNTLRVKLASEQIIIHPRCKTLIYHLKNGTWKKSRKDYDRGADGSHFDAIDSLTYLIRNIQESKNPYPLGYDFLSSSGMFSPYKNKENQPSHQAWVNMFKTRKSIKY